MMRSGGRLFALIVGGVIAQTAASANDGSAGQSWQANIPEAYPSEALQNDLEGKVVVGVTVDTNGRVSECEVIGSSGSDVLDQSACDSMRRFARYTIGRDEQGDPRESYDEKTIEYRIGGDPPENRSAHTRQE